MTDECWEEVREFAARYAGYDATTKDGVGVHVSEEVPIGEPELSGPPFAIGIRVHPEDFADVQRRSRQEAHDRELRAAGVHPDQVKMRSGT